MNANGKNKAPVVPAKKSDWTACEMPPQHTKFTIHRKLSAAEMAVLKLGHIPEEMEDKWFWYYEGGKLYAHRSWTGFCVYILSFTSGSDAIEVTANRDPKQYGCTDDAKDAETLKNLLNWWTKPAYDYYSEWLEEVLNNLQNSKFPIHHETLTVSDKTCGAVYFHKPDQPHGFLSNWYLSDFVLDGAKFSSAEQYIMYRKCTIFGDAASANLVLATDDPAQQQAIARKAAGYNDTVWSGLRQVVLLRALTAKFTQNNELRQALLNTGDDYLVECARHDKLWACGAALEDSARLDISTWSGRNILGFALMEVRTMLHSQELTQAAVSDPLLPQEDAKQHTPAQEHDQMEVQADAEVEVQEEPPKGTIRISLGDITKLGCDCIVTAADKDLLGGGGVDAAIHRVAGPELMKECRALGGCATGQAKITHGYHLSAKWVIHTVGPVYSGKSSDALLLEECYLNSLDLAKNYGIHSIAFPAISTGAYGYPLEAATAVAISAVKQWLESNRSYAIDVNFCCFSQHAYDVYQSYAAESNI